MKEIEVLLGKDKSKDPELRKTMVDIAVAKISKRYLTLVVSKEQLETLINNPETGIEKEISSYWSSRLTHHSIDEDVSKMEFHKVKKKTYDFVQVSNGFAKPCITYRFGSVKFKSKGIFAYYVIYLGEPLFANFDYKKLLKEK
jgi:hypothetical protein